MNKHEDTYVELELYITSSRRIHSRITDSPDEDIDIEKCLEIVTNYPYAKRKGYIVYESRKPFLGCEAIEFDKKYEIDLRMVMKYHYTMLLNQENPRDFTPLKERFLIFKKDKCFYRIKYSADQEDFDKYLPAYERMKESFKFLE